MAPTWLYSTRSGPNRSILSSTRNYLVLDYNKPVNTTRNVAITSYNMLSVSLLCLLRLGMRGMVSIYFPFIFKILRKNIWYSGKKTLTWTGPKSLSPTRPDLKIFQKRVPIADWFWSGPGKLGFSGCPAGLYYKTYFDNKSEKNVLFDVHRFRWVKYDMDGTNPVDLDVNDPRITLTDGNLEIGNPKDPNVESQQLVSADDEGVYQCIAENVYGSALSKKMKAQLACK